MKTQVCPFTSGNVKLTCDDIALPWGTVTRLSFAPSAFFKLFLRSPLQPTTTTIWCSISFAYVDFLFTGTGSSYRKGSCSSKSQSDLGMGKGTRFGQEALAWHSSQVRRTSAPTSIPAPPWRHQWPEATCGFECVWTALLRWSSHTVESAH